MVCITFCVHGDLLIAFAKCSDLFFAVSALNFCINRIYLAPHIGRRFPPASELGELAMQLIADF